MADQARPGPTRTRTFRDTDAQAAAVAYVQKQNTTCGRFVGWLSKQRAQAIEDGVRRRIAGET